MSGGRFVLFVCFPVAGGAWSAGFLMLLGVAKVQMLIRGGWSGS